MTSERPARGLEDLTAQDLRVATDRFAGLIKSRLPLRLDAAEPWPVIAHGALARAGRLMESLTQLAESEQEADAQVLLRVLFELVTIFCWIAISPEKHLSQWAKWSAGRQLKVHNDALQYGVEVLSASELQELGPREKPLDLVRMALEVDEYWPDHSPAFRPHPAEGPKHILTFRGFYTTVYRKGSTAVHTDLAVLDRFLSLPSDKAVEIHWRELPGPHKDFPALAVPFMGFLMIAFSKRFDWPGEGAVRNITDAVMYRDD
jgi:hypothetical protein